MHVFGEAAFKCMVLPTIRIFTEALKYGDDSGSSFCYTKTTVTKVSN